MDDGLITGACTRAKIYPCPMQIDNRNAALACQLLSKWSASRRRSHGDAALPRGGTQKAHRDRRQPAGVGPRMCPGDERIAPAIGGNQKVAECAADQPDKNSRKNAGG